MTSVYHFKAETLWYIGTKVSM